MGTKIVKNHILLLLLLFISCQPDNTNDSNTKKKFNQDWVILCDITNPNLDQIAQNAKEIILKAPENVNLYIYNISPDAYQSPITKVNKVANYSKPSEERNFNKKIKKLADSTEKKILQLGTELQNDKSKNKFRNSCIINSIKSTYKNVFNKIGNTQKKLFILSDMIEECNDTPIGKISKSDLVNPEYIISKINKKFSPKTNFKNKNVEIFIIVSSSFDHNKSNVSGESIEKFWNAVFIKYGYDNEDLSKMGFGVELPDFLK